MPKPTHAVLFTERPPPSGVAIRYALADGIEHEGVFGPTVRTQRRSKSPNHHDAYDFDPASPEGLDWWIECEPLRPETVCATSSALLIAANLTEELVHQLAVVNGFRYPSGVDKKTPLADPVGPFGTEGLSGAELMSLRDAGLAERVGSRDWFLTDLGQRVLRIRLLAERLLIPNP